MGESAKFSNKAYAFVGAPQFGAIYSETISGEILYTPAMDNYIKTMSYTVGGAAPGVRTIHAVYPAEEVSFSKACRMFGEMMDRESIGG